MGYLLVVVAAPISFLIISLPMIIDQEFATPLMARLLFIGAIALGAAGLWATHIEPDRLRVDSHGLGARGATRPIVVGVIADLQTPSIGDHERNAVDSVLEAEPHVVVLAGDLYQFDPEDASLGSAAWATLAAYGFRIWRRPQRGIRTSAPSCSP